jgi:transcriptional regulator with XRE-family HTH domain
MTMGMNTQLTFGEYVRRCRKGNGWALRNLAKDTGISLSQLSRLENDKVIPDADAMVKLANSLGIDLADMLKMANRLPSETIERPVQRASETALRKAWDILGSLFGQQSATNSYHLGFVAGYKALAAQTQSLIPDGAMAGEGEGRRMKRAMAVRREAETEYISHYSTTKALKPSKG